MQTCIMSSLPRCIFRCSVFRYVTLVSFFFLFFFKLCYLIVTLLLWWRINTYLLTYSCLVSLILMPFDMTKWLTQIFVDCNRFNKGEINHVRIEWIKKRIQGYMEGVRIK